MREDIRIDVGLGVEATPDSLRKLNQDVQKAAEVTIRHGYQNTGMALPGGVNAAKDFTNQLSGQIKHLRKFAGKIGLIGAAAAGAVIAFDKLHQAFKTMSLGIDRLSKQAGILEDKRLAILRTQLDYLGKQLDIANRFKAAMQEAELIVERAERNKAERAAEIQKEKDDAIAGHEKRAQNHENRLQAQKEKMLTHGAKDSWEWSRTFNKTGNVRLANTWGHFGYEQSATGQRANRQTFDLDGQKIHVDRNRSRGGYMTDTGVVRIVHGPGMYEDHAFSSEAEYEAIINRQVEQRKESRREQLQNEKSEEEEKALEKTKAKNIEFATEKLEQDMRVLRAKVSEEFENALAGLISDVGDSTTYAIRKAQIQAEHAAKTQRLNEYEQLRRGAAETGQTEISDKDKQRLDAQRV